MTYVNTLLDDLFGGKKSNFTHRENFKNPVEEDERVRKWMASAEGRITFDRILKTYKLKKAGLQDSMEMSLLTSPYANGFAISYEPSISEKTFSDLFFAFGFRMLDLNYYRVSLERTISETAQFVKITERQYFKPSAPSVDVQKTDQRYGNVSIEKERIDNKATFLKVLVTVYSDQHYHDARPFDEFIDKLFNH